MVRPTIRFLTFRGLSWGIRLVIHSVRKAVKEALDTVLNFVGIDQFGSQNSKKKRNSSSSYCFSFMGFKFTHLTPLYVELHLPALRRDP